MFRSGHTVSSAHKYQSELSLQLQLQLREQPDFEACLRAELDLLHYFAIAQLLPVVYLDPDDHREVPEVSKT